MDDWVLWVVAAGALAVGEMATLSFFLGPLAVAALVAAVVALAGGALAIQLVVFILVAALVGSRALVLERVDAHGGCVKIGGEVWSARAYDEDEVMEPGTRVDVLKIDGATALVSE